MQAKDIPNLISLLRLAMVPPVLLLILSHHYDWALALFFLAGLSDGVDGFLAKRHGWQSELGGLLDPLADKLLMISSILALAAQGLLPAWLALVVLARDAVIVAGALSYRVLFGPFEAAPTLLSKLNTGVQILVVLFVLIDQVAALAPDLAPLFLLALGLALASGADYVIRWSRRARHNQSR